MARQTVWETLEDADELAFIKIVVRGISDVEGSDVEGSDVIGTFLRLLKELLLNILEPRQLSEPGAHVDYRVASRLRDYIVFLDMR